MDTMTPQPPADWRAPAQPELNHKQLKALAKASRPWYAKKRTWVAGFFGLIIFGSAIGAASGGGSDGTSTKQNGGVSTLSNNGKNPPQADVALDKCGTTQFGAFPEATLRVTNHSSERSDYMININFLDASGTKIGDGFAMTDNIDPGQSAVTSAAGLGADPKATKTCQIVEVDRFASN